MTEVTVLVTCAGGGLSAQFIRLLKGSQRHSFRVVAVDMSTGPVARHFADVFETVPSGADPSYPDVMAEICRKCSVNLIFPCSDEEVIALMPHKKKLNSAGVMLACNDPEVISIITDKIATYRQLEKLGIPMPLWRVASNAKELTGALDDILAATGNAAIKNPRGRGGRGIFVINSSLQRVEQRPGSQELHMNRNTFIDDYAEALLKDEPILVMERLIDPVCDLDVLAWKGKSVTMVPRRRHSSTAPNEGHVLFQSDELETIGRKIVGALNMSWLFDIDFMMNSRQQPIVLEINPRASGSVAVGMIAGIPLMDDLVSLAYGETPVRTKIPYGRHIYAFNALSVR